MTCEHNYIWKSINKDSYVAKVGTCDKCGDIEVKYKVMGKEVPSKVDKYSSLMGECIDDVRKMYPEMSGDEVSSYACSIFIQFCKNNQ